MKLAKDRQADCWFIGFLVKSARKHPTNRFLMLNNAANHAYACGLAWKDQRFIALSERLAELAEKAMPQNWWNKL